MRQERMTLSKVELRKVGALERVECGAMRACLGCGILIFDPFVYKIMLK